MSQSLDLQDLGGEVGKFYLNLLGYKPQRSGIFLYDSNNWAEFRKSLNLDSRAEGAYLPRNLTSHIFNNKNLELSFFHEHFGHGLFYEYAYGGRNIVRLEKKLATEEKAYFRETRWDFEEVIKFRESNSTSRIIRSLNEETYNLFELFAIWTEKNLSEKFGNPEQFNRKYDSLSPDWKDAVSELTDTGNKFGELALFYSCGFAKYMVQKSLIQILIFLL